MNSRRRAARLVANMMLNERSPGPLSIIVRPHLLTAAEVLRVLRDAGGRGVRVVRLARGIRFVEMHVTAKTDSSEFRDAVQERLSREAHKVPEGLEFPRGNWW